ncbi:MAG: hypothetical protein A3B31_02325 [Candidatus Komeilibacteria bacterium RIFCSPLOWO2_01_FULL_53_11]|uniref:Uncharacterized protein n=1 Tax=Candidatus Komeilibacteria bacterium RIFCSPLOWO2_01_FULL_53_11 TaxID=1798552 RepID=A0A1G2BQJ2_9BACT|nr:MAG: hypothetical protein A3B31_02325 [Candidatus Komeilibacteria bacterium RIFCSPLOWO2_01_FULL_53_11]
MTFTFDTIRAFRHAPFLYFFVFFIALGLCVLLFFVLSRGEETFIAQRSIPTYAEYWVTETQDQRGARSVIMNVLNGFGNDPEFLAAEASDTDRIYVQSEKIHQAIDNLQGLSTGGGYLDDARDDVVHALTAWDEFLLIGGDQASVREQFVAIGTKHPWLNTLVWFIIVNRL